VPHGLRPVSEGFQATRPRPFRGQLAGNASVVIGDTERGLVYRNRRIKRVLGPGVYRLWAWFHQLEVHLLDAVRKSSKKAFNMALSYISLQQTEG